MRTRIIAAAFLVPALLLIVLVLPKGIAAVFMGILQVIASYELLYRTRLVTKSRLVVYNAAMAFAIALWSFYGAVHAYFVLLMLVYFLLMFSEMMRDHVKMRFETLSMCFVGGLVVPYLMSSVVRILASNLGQIICF